MKSLVISSLCLSFVSVMAAADQDVDKMDINDLSSAHIQYQRGQSKPSNGGGTSSPLMTDHGGSVIHTSKTMAIFWGSSWADPTFAGDKISGMDLFFGGYGGSNYAATVKEYGDSVGLISGSSSYLGHVMDASAPPNKAASTSNIVSEACRIVNNNPDPSAVYFVFTSTAAGHVSYCAWHSWGQCSNGAQIQVAYIPNLDGVAGCDPQDTATKNSPGLAAIANVSAHELSEAITDPRGATWYDSSGEENGDKCAWSFPPNGGVSKLANNSTFKLQMEWSNAAYSQGTGLPNRSGQNGCIY